MVEHIGTQVNVPGTRGKAILRYHGSIHGKTGIFAGLELLGPIALTRGKNNGDVEGFKYFQVQNPMSGLFIPFERLKTVNPNLDFTRDMIHEVNHEFHNDSLNDDIVYPNEYMPETASSIYSPTPRLNSNQTGSNIPRPYSADISKSRIGQQSPLASTTSGGLNISKRQNKHSNSMGPSLDRSRTSSVGSFSKSPLLNSNYRSYSLNLDHKYHNNTTSPISKRYSNGQNAFLEQELYEIRSKYERSERDMIEKVSILNELRETVQELQPILKQYETELTEKDKKIAKIRNEFESAREDWRQNLDIMVNTYEANENFYESKIKELQLKVTEQSSNPDGKAEKEKELETLNGKYKELVQSKDDLEEALNKRIDDLLLQLSKNDSKELNKKILEQQTEIESLSKELMTIHKFPNDNSSAQTEVISKLQNEIEGLVHFKERAATMEKQNNELKQELERRHSFEKLEDKNRELTKLQDVINDLKEQLSSKEREIVELEDNLDAKVKELNSKVPLAEEGPKDVSPDVKELREDMFFKDQEIKALQQQLNKANETISSQKHSLKTLKATEGNETAQGVPDDTGKDERIKELENEVSRLKDSVGNEGAGTRDTEHAESLKNRFASEIQEKDHIIQELERKLHEALASELDSLNINDAAAINEMTFKKEINDLRHELEARPTIEELTELQDNIDEMLRLHNNEIFFKDEEIQRMLTENNKLQVRLERALEGSIMTNRISDNSHDENISINSELPIYKPDTDIDPSSGKENWCGLCERDGHSSLNCPYENDIF